MKEDLIELLRKKKKNNDFKLIILRNMQLLVQVKDLIKIGYRMKVGVI